MLDIIEIRPYNYFEFKGQIKQISIIDLVNIETLLPLLRPLSINSVRLSRLNFASITISERRLLQKFCANVYFNFHRIKDDKLLLVVNNEIKLPHIKYIHQLQNLYYDMTEDILKLPEHLV